VTEKTIFNISAFKNMITRIFSGPAFPLAFLINGSFFYFAFFHIIGAKPNPYLTGGYYCALIGWAFFVLIKKDRHVSFRFHYIDLFFFLFIFFIFASFILRGLEGNQKQLIYLFVFVLFPYVCGRLISLSDVALFLSAIFLIGVVGLILAAIDTIVEWNDVMSWVRPFFFGFNHTTLLVGFLLGSIILLSTFYFMLSEKQLFGFRSTLVFWGILLISVGSLIFIKCRGVLIATLVISICGCILLYWVSWKRRIVVALGLVGLVVFFFNIMPSSLCFIRQAKKTVEFGMSIPEVSSPESLNIYENSLAMRFLLWNEATRMFAENPIIGVGAGCFADHSTIENAFPHSTIIQSLAELGILGASLFLIYVAQIFFSMVIMFRYGRYEYSLQKKSVLIFSLWFFYFMIDQIYGDYLRNIAFTILSGMSVSMIVYAKDNQIILDDA